MVFLVLWPSSPKVNLTPITIFKKKNVTSPLQSQLCFSPIVCCPLFFSFRFRCLLLGQSFFTKKLLGGTKVTSTWRFFFPQGLCPWTWFTYNCNMKNICIDNLKFWTVLFFGGQGKCIDIYKCVAMTVMIVFLCFVSLFLWFLLFLFGRPSRHPNANCQWLVLGNLHRLSRFSIGFEPFNWIGSVGCSSSGCQEKKRLTRILGYSTSFKDGKVTITKESSALAIWRG